MSVVPLRPSLGARFAEFCITYGLGLLLAGTPLLGLFNGHANLFLANLGVALLFSGLGLRWAGRVDRLAGGREEVPLRPPEERFAALVLARALPDGRVAMMARYVNATLNSRVTRAPRPFRPAGSQSRTGRCWE